MTAAQYVLGFGAGVVVMLCLIGAVLVALGILGRINS